MSKMLQIYSFFIITSLVVISCDDPGLPEFRMNEHYIVVDYSVQGTCEEDVDVSYKGTALEFIRDEEINTSNDTMAPPIFTWATNHSVGYLFLDRCFIKYKGCRLLIDVDAVKATTPVSSLDDILSQIENQPTVPFQLSIQFSHELTGTSATIDATFLPHTFDQFSKCHNNGGYKQSEYDNLYGCIESLTPHSTIIIQ